MTRQNISELYQNRNSQIGSTDLFSAINGDSQIVNVYFSRTINNKVYLSFYNLDLPSVIQDKPYELYFQTIDYYGIICFSCPIGMYLGRGCYCQTCLANYYGKRCNYYITTMQEGRRYTTTLNSITNSYFRIQDPPELIDLYYYEQHLTHNIHLYVQYEQIKGDLAGYLNTYFDYANKSYQKLVSINENNFSVSTGGRSLMITVSSKNTGHSAQVVLRFQNPNKSRIGFILGLTFGIVGFLVVIIVIACCCRKRRERKVVVPNSIYLTRR